MNNVTEKLNRVIWALSETTHEEIKADIMEVIKNNDGLKFDNVLKIMENTQDIHNIEKARELLEMLEEFIPAGEDFSEVLPLKNGEPNDIQKAMETLANTLGIGDNITGGLPTNLFGSEEELADIIHREPHPEFIEYNPLEECVFVSVNHFTFGFIASIYKSLCKKITKDGSHNLEVHMLHALNCLGYIFLERDSYETIYASILEIYKEKDIVPPESSLLLGDSIDRIYNRHNAVTYLKTIVEQTPQVEEVLATIEKNPLIDYKIIGYEREWAVMEENEKIILTAATAK